MQLEEVKLNEATIEADLEALLRCWFETELSNGAATLIVESIKDKSRSGKSVSLVPSRNDCATITAFCENGDDIIYLTLGEDTQLEMPLRGKRYTPFENVGELAAVVNAVAAGKMEETIWIRNTKIVKSVGKILIDSGPPITIRSSTVTNPFAPVRKKEYKYLPYSQWRH